ncbi:MAG: neutral zinc metallopeptidase [Alphaproteobacteria bacterium]|nr:neutral zinc metallopeptidase [Alphaproteobacteria bacterium]
MRWDDFRQSENVEDRRGEGGGFGGGGGGFGIPIGRGGIGIGTLIVVGLVSWALGINPLVLLSGGDILPQGGPSYTQQAGRTGAPEDRAGRFASAVLAQTEDVWAAELPRQANRSYQAPRLVLFSGGTQSGCGFAQAQVGPFYCPTDRRLYIDLDFLARMQAQLGARGDFAAAYVIAHEVGHHVENLLGILSKAQQAQRSAAGSQANAVSVRTELMADCLAGVWAFHADKNWRILESGDVAQAMNAAAAVGDDRLQRAGQGYVVPDSFTHGSSAQRTRWFSAGLKTGQISACNTFAGAQP